MGATMPWSECVVGGKWDNLQLPFHHSASFSPMPYPFCFLSSPPKSIWKIGKSFVNYKSKFHLFSLFPLTNHLFPHLFSFLVFLFFRKFWYKLKVRVWQIVSTLSVILIIKSRTLYPIFSTNWRQSPPISSFSIIKVDRNLNR